MLDVEAGNGSCLRLSRRGDKWTMEYDLEGADMANRSYQECQCSGEAAKAARNMLLLTSTAPRRRSMTTMSSQGRHVPVVNAVSM